MRAVRAEMLLRVGSTGSVGIGIGISCWISSAGAAGVSSAGAGAWTLTSTSSLTTFSSSTSIVRCALACWVCNKLDTSWAESVVKR